MKQTYTRGCIKLKFCSFKITIKQTNFGKTNKEQKEGRKVKATKRVLKNFMPIKSNI